MKNTILKGAFISIIALAIGVLHSTSCSAQSTGAAINTTGAAADNSAMLDVSSSTQGMLVPRLALTSTTSQSPIIATPANSLLVYNTATAGDVTPGYYYWDVSGAKWVRMVSGAAVTSVGTGTGLSGGPITSTGIVSLANGTAAGQTYVTGASPFTPSLVTISGDASITSIGTVKVNAIESATTSINLNAATAPTTGQVLTATSGTAATWQNPATGSGDGDIRFPDGYTGVTAVDALVNGYVVPAGKTLYITSLFMDASTSKSLRTVSSSGPILYQGTCDQMNNTLTGSSPYNPWIIPAGTTLAVANTSSTEYITGFLINTGVTTVVATNLNTTPYTVPAGKTLYIMNLYSPSGADLQITFNSVFTRIYYGNANTYNNSTGGAWDGVRTAIIVTGGNQVKSNNDAVSINGYLK